MIQAKAKKTRESELFTELTGILRGGGVDSAPLDAVLILGEARGERGVAFEFARRRAGGEPLAYILGRKEFMSIEMAVDPRVLVPRPETETVVETAERWAARLRCRPEPAGRSLAHSRRHGFGYGASEGALRPTEEGSSACRSQHESARECPAGSGCTYLDIGTGSGNIAVSLLVRNPGDRAVAVDISESALTVAGSNARSHGVLDRMRLVCCDAAAALAGSFEADILVSNPPYIADPEFETLPPGVRESEPRIALSGGSDGLDFYRRLACSIPGCLRKGGVAVLEVGYDQASRVSRILSEGGMEVEEVVKDLAGIDRVVVGRA